MGSDMNTSIISTFGQGYTAQAAFSELSTRAFYDRGGSWDNCGGTIAAADKMVVQKIPGITGAELVPADKDACATLCRKYDAKYRAQIVAAQDWTKYFYGKNRKDSPDSVPFVFSKVARDQKGLFVFGIPLGVVNYDVLTVKYKSINRATMSNFKELSLSVNGVDIVGFKTRLKTMEQAYAYVEKYIAEGGCVGESNCIHLEGYHVKGGSVQLGVYMVNLKSTRRKPKADVKVLTNRLYWFVGTVRDDD